jgi:hypothetical protein
VYLAVAQLDPAKSQSWYSGLILGTVLSMWASLWWLDHKLDSVRDTVSKTGNLKIRVLRRTEVLPTVAWLYRAAGVKFYATHIGYREIDRREKNPGDDDVARHIYAGAEQIPFLRIVHVRDEEDREWVRRMIAERTNPNYCVKILEGETSPLPYPNFVIAEGTDGESQLFMSFRGATTDASGRFAFLTSNPELIRGIREHFDRFFNDLPSAEECITRWSSS